MPTEKTTNSIYGKLLEFQRQYVTVKKAGSNPHFKSKYTTLNDVLEAVKKPLNDLGVLVLPVPGETGLTLRLVATEDGSEVTGFMPYVSMSDPQKLGGNNTYNERYLFLTMLALEQEDDDGTISSSKPTYHASETVKTAPQPAGGQMEFTVQGIDRKKSAKGTDYLALSSTLPYPLLVFGKAMDMIRVGGRYSAPLKINEKGDTYMIDGYEDVLHDLDALPF